MANVIPSVALDVGPPAVMLVCWNSAQRMSLLVEQCKPTRPAAASLLAMHQPPLLTLANSSTLPRPFPTLHRSGLDILPKFAGFIKSATPEEAAEKEAELVAALGELDAYLGESGGWLGRTGERGPARACERSSACFPAVPACLQPDLGGVQ